MRFFFFSLLCVYWGSYAQSVTKTEVLLLMGSRFEITPVASSTEEADIAIQAAINEIKRIEALISEFYLGSQVDEINKNAGILPVKVDKELFDLIARCIKVSQLTDGSFDICWAAASGLWKFDGTMTEVPSEDQIKNILPLIDYRKIILDKEKQTVFLQEKGMKIGFGAIGKGYAANKARDIMKKQGIANGVVIAGGDLITWGKPADAEFWVIGVASPDEPEQAIAWLNVSEMGVVTSGNYEKFANIHNKKYSHIINPKTGLPVEGLKSVTIICPDAELADALATGVTVLGVEKGLSLINQLNGVECLMIDDKNKFILSDGLKLNYYKATENKQYNHEITIGK